MNIGNNKKYIKNKKLNRMKNKMKKKRSLVKRPSSDFE